MAAKIAPIPVQLDAVPDIQPTPPGLRTMNTIITRIDNDCNANRALIQSFEDANAAMQAQIDALQKRLDHIEYE